MARFLVAAEGLTKIEADAITALFSSKGYEYWHWIENVWLIETGPGNDFTAKGLYLEFVRSSPLLELKVMLVMRMDDPRSYWGRADKRGWDWLRKGFGGTPG